MEAVWALRDDGAAEIVAGMQNQRAGRFAEAVIHFERVVPMHAADVQLRYRLAQSLEGAGELIQAVAEYEDAAWRAPDHIGVRLALADLLNRCGRQARAFHHWREVLRSDLLDARTRTRLTALLRDAEPDDETIDDGAPQTGSDPAFTPAGGS